MFGKEYTQCSGRHFIETCFRILPDQEVENMLKSVSSSRQEESIVYWLKRFHLILASFRGNPRLRND